MIQIDSTIEEDIEEIKEGTITGPELDPMCLFLKSGKHNSWNDTLCYMFSNYFKEEQDVELMLEEKKLKIYFLIVLAAFLEMEKFSDEEMFKRTKRSNQWA